MRTLLRNLLSVLRRYRMATGLNIAGLSVAFAAFIAILIQIHYERSFDTSYPTSDRIFRVELTEASDFFSYTLPRAFVEDVIVSSPNIEAGSLLTYSFPVYITTYKEGEKLGFREPVLSCHPDLVEVFGFSLVEGDLSGLKDPDKVIIPQSMARKIYGKESAVGKAFHLEQKLYTKDEQDFIISAVFEDFPKNSQMQNSIYTAIDPQLNLKNYGSSMYLCYLLLDDPSMADVVVSNFNNNYNFELINDPDEAIKLTPVTDIYYMNDIQDGTMLISGNRETTFLLFCIAVLIIIVAIINFTNFSTALTPIRIKSINTQKVLGSSDSFLRRTLTIESVIISFISWLVSLFIVFFLNRVGALPFIQAELSLLTNIPIVLISGLIALITGVIAGVYPAWYMVSFPPALVLKGSFGLSASGRKMRTALIGVQFVVSIMLIIGAGFVWLQNDYMKNYSLGFDKDQIAIVELSGDTYHKHKDTYVNRLKEFTGIEDVAFSFEKVASFDTYNTASIDYKNKVASYFLILGSYNLLDVLGVPITEGRNFTKSDEVSKETAYIFNKTAHLNMDMELGDLFCSWMPGRIVGFTEDVKLTSLRQGENNVAFVLTDKPYPYNYSYIRMKAGTDVHALVSHVRKTLNDIDPTYPFEVEFYDTVYDHLYRNEVNLRSTITLFSLIAIILSLVGVFGLVVFETQYRRKEIAVRKVHGSTIREILNRLNQHYVYIVCVCFFLAIPVAYYMIQKWLEGFAYKVPVSWWLYAVAFIIVLLITIATVTFQSWRAAAANPVDSLKAE